MGEVNRFEDLNCYKEARVLRIEVARFAKALPKIEEYRLKDQIIRASRSVTANIAEGYGRHHHQENIQFCRIARGSLTETKEHINTGLDEEYLNTDSYEWFCMQIDKSLKLLNGYISYLVKCSKEGS